LPIIKTFGLCCLDNGHSVFSIYAHFFNLAGSIMKCNTWRSRKEPVILSGYGKAIPAFEHG
jgi:hypothetical protein